MADEEQVCANCGKESSAVVKLKNCTACRLVKYCGVDCQRAHRKQHKLACKKRAAELKDERLYSQGWERPEDDFCPVCMLPIPLPMSENSGFSACCMKKLCHGCSLAAQKRGMMDCPFCRTPRHEDDTSALAMVQKRVGAKDPIAIKFLGDRYCDGMYGLEMNLLRAMELWTEAAKLGSAEAHHNLGNAYYSGKTLPRDDARARHHWEAAAMKGYVEARGNLCAIDKCNGNYESAVRHSVIAAKMGDKMSLGNMKELFASGHATKQQYGEALLGYQAATEEMKSPERDEAQALKAFL